ncbi:HAMP domain-containing protein [Neptunomonas sp. XY-337]|uniref:HAMP domain-containing protein n=1 Tax=Neptunomonas sp. XY-337 TaxID=2561897 RepID=UPI0010A9C7CB|nr:HAMP domain-containing protein [Neptunomonas sp. XY-337]
MSRQYTGSIRSKVIMITLVCTTAILAAVGVYDALEVVAKEEAQLEDRANVTAQRIARHLTIPVWNLDKERIDASIEAEMLEPSVLAIVVHDSDGKDVMGAKERDYNWEIIGSSGTVQTGAFAISDAPVFYEDKAIGSVSVYISDRFVKEDIQFQVILEVVRVVALNLVIFVILVLLLGKFLITPIRRLAEQASEISSGRLNTVIDISSNDEIGLLADSLSRMQRSLSVAFKKIRQANKAREQ